MPRSIKYRKKKYSKKIRGGRITTSETKKLQGAREFWKNYAPLGNPTEKKERSSLVKIRNLKAAQQRRSNYTISRKKSLSDSSNQTGHYITLKTPEKDRINSLAIIEESREGAAAEAAAEAAEAAAAARAAKLQGIRRKRDEKDLSEERKLKEIFALYDALGTEQARKISPKIEAVINQPNSKPSEVIELLKSNGPSSSSSITRNQIKELEERQRKLGNLEVNAAFSPKEKKGLLKRLFRKKSSKKEKTRPMLYGGTRKI